VAEETLLKIPPSLKPIQACRKTPFLEMAPLYNGWELNPVPPELAKQVRWRNEDPAQRDCGDENFTDVHCSKLLSFLNAQLVKIHLARLRRLLA